jgi:uncharacterized protein (DUF1697 family)
MARYVAFLRAINVGGHVVKMDRLRALFEELELGNVKTVIASGNVLFDAAAKNVGTLERRIEAHLWKALGYEVQTFVRSPKEIAAILAHDPFARSKQRTAESRLFIGFLKATPPAEICKSLDGCVTPIDEFSIHNREIYWSLTGRSMDSKFSGAALEKMLKCGTTIRNVNTVQRIAELES